MEVKTNNRNPLAGYYFMLFAFFSASCFLPNTLKGQEEVSSLERALEIAGQNNRGLKSKFMAYQASLERIPQQGSLPDPELSFGFFIMPMERFMGEQIGEVSLMQMFPWFGSLKAGQEEAALMAKAQYEGFEEARINLFYQVKKQWYSLYQAESTEKLLKEEKKILVSLEKLALATYQSGGSGSTSPPSQNRDRQEISQGTSGMSSMEQTQEMEESNSSMQGSESMGGSSSGSISEVLRIQLQMKSLEDQIQRWEDKSKAIRFELNQLLQAEEKLSFRPSDSLMYPARDYSKIEDWEDSLLRQHPMMQMLEWEGASAQAKEVMAQKMGMPMVGIGLNYMVLRPRSLGDTEMGPMNNGANMLMPMLKVSLPIYRKKYQSLQKEAEWEQQSLAYEKENTLKMLETERVSLGYAWEEARRRFRLAEDQMRLSDQLIRLEKANYRSGGGSMDALLQLQKGHLNFQLDRLDALVNQYQLIADLERLLASDRQAIKESNEY